MKPTRLALYRDADALTDQVSHGAGLACPTGCGACCVRTPPHVSVADMAPIARAVIARSVEEAEGLHARATAVGPGPCVLFAPLARPGARECTSLSLVLAVPSWHPS